MRILSEQQGQRLRKYLHKEWRFCFNCAPRESIRLSVEIETEESVLVFRRAMEDTGIGDEITFDCYKMIHNLINELGYTCPNCSTPIIRENEQLGRIP